MKRYNVTDYGANGHDRKDDTKAIQKAIDAAHKAGGGKVYIPEGTYLVKGTKEASDGAIEIKDHVTLEGAGMGDTIIKLKDGWSGKLTGIIRTPSGRSNEDITIRDLTIDGNMDKTKGEVDGFFSGVTPGSSKTDKNILIERVEIHSVSRYAFDPHERTEKLTIRDSVAHDNGKDGFVLDYVLDSYIANNLSYDNGRHGFNMVTAAHDIVFKNNTAHSNGDNGLVVQRGSEDHPLSHTIAIQGGKFFDNGRDGILLKISTDITVEDASIHNNGQHGLHIMGSRRVIAEDNAIYHNSQSKKGRFDEVRIEQYDDRGGPDDKIFAARDVTLKDNDIRANSSKYGIFERNDSSGDNHIEANKVTGAVKKDIRLTDSKTVFIPFEEEKDGKKDPKETNKSLHGTERMDRLSGEDGDDKLDGKAGHDWLEGDRGADTLIGGDGKDTLVGGNDADRIIGNEGRDFLKGGHGADYISGGDGHDTLRGGFEADTLIGGDGSDKFFAGSGHDTLILDGGNDSAVGGAGLDRFVLHDTAGHVTIHDFAHNDEKIDLREFDFDNYRDFRDNVNVSRFGEHVRIRFDEDTSLTLLDVAVGHLNTDDFIF